MANKALVGLILFTLVSLMPITGWAGNRPKEFRGIKWGTKISTIKDLEEIKGSPDSYTRKNDKLEIGGNSVDSIHYVAEDGKIIKVNVIFPKESSFGIERALREQYGQPDEINNKYSISEIWFANDEAEAQIVFDSMGYLVFTEKAYLASQSGL